MKKMLTLALVALTVASAQALTIDWSTVNWDRLNEETGYTGSKTSNISTSTALSTTVDNTKSWIASTTVSIGTITGWQEGGNISGTTATLLSLAGLFSGVNTCVYGFSSSNYLIRSLISGTGAITSSTTSLANNTSVNVTYAWAADGTGGGTLSVYVNGEQFDSSTITAANTETTSFAVGGLAASWTYAEYCELEKFADYTAEAYVVQSATNESIDALVNSLATTFNVVPEPTCLALLALGVAGLALKRKVA